MGHHHDATTPKHEHDHCTQASHQAHHGGKHDAHFGHEGHTALAESEGGALSMREKLAKMLDHWQHHNEDHGTSYRRWAQHARSEGLEQVAQTLEAVAERSLALNELLNTARKQLEA